MTEPMSEEQLTEEQITVCAITLGFSKDITEVAKAGVKMLDEIRRLRTLLASGIHLPEVDLMGEIEPGRYLVKVSETFFVVVRGETNWLTGMKVVQAWGPIVLPEGGE